MAQAINANLVVLSGRIVSEVVYEFDEEEKRPPMTSFAMLCIDNFEPSGEHAKTYINVVLLKQNAIRAKNMLTKGACVTVTGKLRNKKTRHKGRVVARVRGYDTFVAAREFLLNTR